MLGDLSMLYETGKEPPHYAEAAGVVSSGKDDPGGRSYGAYQLASKTGTLQRFMLEEGRPWQSRFVGLKPADDAYAKAWKAIADREGQTFFDAQHTFIKRTHFDPVVKKVRHDTHLDIAARSEPVQNAIWSMSVQHGRASRLAEAAIRRCQHEGTIDNDLALLDALYAERGRYIDANKSLSKQAKASLHARYASELARAKAEAAKAGVVQLQRRSIPPATVPPMRPPPPDLRLDAPIRIRLQ